MTTVQPGPETPPPVAARRSKLSAVLRARSPWRRLADWAGTRLNRASYLVRWLVLATVIGAVAGLGAIVFYQALRLSTELFLGVLAGYHVPTPAGEGGALGSAHFVRPWAIPLVVVAGALLAGVIVFTWAPEAEGHGTDAAIDAVHRNPRGIRLRAVVVKIVASALTIGSGGSGGREGPTAQISAGFGSLLARTLDLSTADGKTAVSVGIGSGIGAIFGAPLGGAVLAGEIVYRDDFEYSAIVPGLFASIVAYTIFGAVYGYHPLFSMPAYRFDQPLQLLWFAVLGLLAGGIGLLYSKTFYGAARLSSRLPFSRTLRPAAGGLVVGLMALAIPQVLGTGYGWIQQGLWDDLARLPLWIILVLPAARIVATALSIGTGGSGGVFGPGMVIGAFTGLALWRLLEPAVPGVGHDPAPFVVVGMMAVFGSISRAPLAVMIMVAEMTGTVDVVAPAMVAVALATFVVWRNDDSIYRSQLRTRPESGANRSSGMPLLDGTVDAVRVDDAVTNDPDAAAASVLDATTGTVDDSARVRTALEALLHAGGPWVTVEDRVGAESPLADAVVGRASLPPGAIVLSARRGDELLFASGHTTLRAGDLVSALSSPATAEATRRVIRGSEEPDPPPVEPGDPLPEGPVG